MRSRAGPRGCVSKPTQNIYKRIALQLSYVRASLGRLRDTARHSGDTKSRSHRRKLIALQKAKMSESVVTMAAADTSQDMSKNFRFSPRRARNKTSMLSRVSRYSPIEIWEEVQAQTLSQLVAVPFKKTMSTESCQPLCSCRCHTKHRKQTPSKLNKVTGTLVVGYSASSIFARAKCNESTCRAKQSVQETNVTYYLPRWFLAKAVSIYLGRQTNLMTSSKTLTLHNIRNRDDDVFVAARGNDVNKLIKIFQEGRGRPSDVDQEGLSVLWHAVGGAFDPCEATIRYLLDCGSDPFQGDSDGISPYDRAWESILKDGAMCGQDGWVFSKIFPNSEPLSAWGLTTLHKIVLGLNMRGLSEALLDPEVVKDINTKDAQGRTPLWWSIDLGRTPSGRDTLHDPSVEGRNQTLLPQVKMLLAAGADPNLKDSSGKPPLRNAINRSLNIPMVRLLASYGAELSYRETTNMSPLHVAAVYHDNIELLEVLATSPDWKKNLNFPAGFHSRRPLHMAINYGQTRTALWLIEQGADIEEVDPRNGAPPIIAAITKNNFHVVRALVEAGAKLNQSHAKIGTTILQNVASCADTCIMDFLAARRAARGVDLACRGKDDECCNVFEVLARYHWFPSDDMYDYPPESLDGGFARDAFWRLLNTRTCERCALDAKRGVPAPIGLCPVGFYRGWGGVGTGEQVKSESEYWEQRAEYRRWTGRMIRLGLMVPPPPQSITEETYAENQEELDLDDGHQGESGAELKSVATGESCQPPERIIVDSVLPCASVDKAKEHKHCLQEKEEYLPPHGVHVEDDDSICHLWINLGVPKSVPGRQPDREVQSMINGKDCISGEQVENIDDDLVPLLNEKLYIE